MMSFDEIIDAIESTKLYYLRGVQSRDINEPAYFYRPEKQGATLISPKELFDQLCSQHLAFNFDNCCSRGERKIAKYLINNNYSFSTEVSFPNLKDIGHLRFDYAVYHPDTNLLWFLIEFDGAQHFYYTPKYHKTYRDFETSLYRDELKDNYCLYNNIPLLRISYKEEDKIGEKIENFVSSLLSQSYIN
jgi:hypothetical protein